MRGVFLAAFDNFHVDHAVIVGLDHHRGARLPDLAPADGPLGSVASATVPGRESHACRVGNHAAGSDDALASECDVTDSTRHSGVVRKATRLRGTRHFVEREGK